MGKGRSAGRSATTVLAFAALLVLLSAGCGNSGDGDPFAGTWHDPDGSTVAVIASASDGYRVTVYSLTLLNAERNGDRLRAWTELRTEDGELSGRRLEAVFTREPDGDGLVLTDPAGPGLRIELTRTSDATVIPSPWPREARSDPRPEMTRRWCWPNKRIKGRRGAGGLTGGRCARSLSAMR